VQQRRTLQKQPTRARTAAIELGKSAIDECGIGIQVRREPIEAAPEQIQYTWHIVFSSATGGEKKLDAIA